ncbi:EsaB/YukD family protein [Streptomyces clavifer]|uniref:EsaB/YukD family protein n=1 Tax=Streptomyces clavifer TaxID=68188 RepID=UPI0037F313AF
MTSRTKLSRVPLAGERHRADIALPSRAPIGRLLPDMLQLLNDRAASRPLARQLLTSDGAVLPRHTRSRSVPPAPDVHDVADHVAGELDLHTSRRRPVARRTTAGMATNVSTLIAAQLARGERWQGAFIVARAVGGSRRIVSSAAARAVFEITRTAQLLQQPVTTGRQTAVKTAVTSIRGGAGKSTGTVLLGTTYAHYRQDPVLLVEADPALGSLPLRLGVRSLRPSAPSDVFGWAQALPRRVIESMDVARTERASRA